MCPELCAAGGGGVEGGQLLPEARTAEAQLVFLSAPVAGRGERGLPPSGLMCTGFGSLKHGHLSAGTLAH